MLLFTLIGTFYLMLLMLQFSQKEMAHFFSGWQKKILASSLDAPFKKMLPRALLLVLTEASPQRTQMTSLAFYNLRILGKRPSLLLMALSNLGAWWILILTLLFMNVNAVMLVGVFVLPALLMRKIKWVGPLFAVLFSTALFFVLSESLVRQLASLPAMMGESEIVFWLADGRFSAVLGLAFVAILLTFLIQVEFWSVCLALALLFSSIISFNGALALFAGERIARGILFAWSGRILNQDCRLISREEGIAASVGAGLGLWVTLYLREVTDLGRSFGISEAQGRLFDFALGLVLILFVQFCVQMFVNHFAVQKKVDEFQDIRYYPGTWYHGGRMSKAGAEWGRQQIAKRIQEIRYHIQGLATFKEGQIPDHVQGRLRKEEEELAKLIKE